MIRSSKKWRYARLSAAPLALVAMLASAGSAGAVPVLVNIEATVVNGTDAPLVPGGSLPIFRPGDPFFVHLLLESTTPNQATAPDFLAFDPGTIQVLGLGESSIVSVTSSPSGVWSLSTFFSGSALADLSIELTGNGLSPAQVIPDFSEFLSGVVIARFAGIDPLEPFSEAITANITGLSVTVVPEPASLVLLGIGLAGLTVAGAPRAARRA